MRRLWLEELEPRVAPAANLNYDWGTAAGQGNNLALKVGDPNGNSTLQIVDSNAQSVLGDVHFAEEMVATVKAAQLHGAGQVFFIDLAGAQNVRYRDRYGQRHQRPRFSRPRPVPRSRRSDRHVADGVA
jgi:hypothetical protein